MHLLFSEQFFNSQVIQAVSWTLIHSLWQGMLLSMVAGTIIYSTKKSRPALRYNLLVSALVVFIVLVISTFSIQLNTPKQIPHQLTGPSGNELNYNNYPLIALDEHAVSLPTKVTSFLNAYAGWIVITWILIILVKSVQLGSGIYGIFQLKRRNTFLPGDYWMNRISELSEQLHIKRRVRLLRSGLATVPAVVGFFKPVILFPAAMLAGLSPGQIEAILIHELAHIKRQDFLVNMLQHFIEMIFFFNPAVLWVSSLIKIERENCCDDIAVGTTQNKQNYINALMSFHEFDPKPTHFLSNAFGGTRTHLVDRVKRIIYNNNKTLNAMEKKFLSAGMIITCAIIFAFTSNDTVQPTLKKSSTAPAINVHAPQQVVEGLEGNYDTVPKTGKSSKNISSGTTTGTINTTLNGKKYVVVIANDEVIKLKVNGKDIPQDKIANYKTETDKILANADAELDESHKEMEQSKLDLEQSKVEMEQSQKELAEVLEQSRNEMEHSQKEFAESLEQSKKELEQSQKELAEEMERMNHDMIIDSKSNGRLSIEDKTLSTKQRAEMKKSMELQTRQIQQSMQQAKVQMAQDMKQQKVQMELVQREMVLAQKQMEQAKIQIAQSKRDMEKSQKLQEEVISDFVTEGLIKDKTELRSYKLSDEELIINGVKQSDAIHKKFKSKFVKNKAWSMQYNNN